MGHLARGPFQADLVNAGPQGVGPWAEFPLSFELQAAVDPPLGEAVGVIDPTGQCKHWQPGALAWGRAPTWLPNLGLGHIPWQVPLLSLLYCQGNRLRDVE